MAKGRDFPIIQEKKLHQIGASIMISLPLDWFRVHGLGDTPAEIKQKIKSLLVLGNLDIRIVNPDNREEVVKGIYTHVSEEVAKAKLRSK